MSYCHILTKGPSQKFNFSEKGNLSYILEKRKFSRQEIFAFFDYREFAGRKSKYTLKFWKYTPQESNLPCTAPLLSSWSILCRISPQVYTLAIRAWIPCSPDRSGVYRQCSYSVGCTYTAGTLPLAAGTLHRLQCTCSVHCMALQVHCRYTPLRSGSLHITACIGQWAVRDFNQ